MFRRALAAGVLAVGCLSTASVLGAPAAQAARPGCADVDVSFARGTGEPPGVGPFTGVPFVDSVKANLGARSVSVYAVDYAASFDQTSAGAGSRDLVEHLTSVAAACPRTRFVIGGYSQGAQVVDNAVGIATSTSANGAVIPAALTRKVKAVVVFGDPLGAQGRSIETSTSSFRNKAKSYCNPGDPVCGAGLNFFSHLAYGTSGLAAQGGQFAASRIR